MDENIYMPYERRIAELEAELAACIKDSQKWGGRLAESEEATEKAEAEIDRLLAAITVKDVAMDRAGIYNAFSEPDWWLKARKAGHE